MKHYFRIIAAVVFALSMHTAPALACDCATISDEEALSTWSNVFTAEAKSKVTHIGEKYIETNILEVKEVFKGGASGDLLPLHNKGDCSFQFVKDKTYLVFADIESEIHVKASICSPTRIIETPDDVPASLRNKETQPAATKAP